METLGLLMEGFAGALTPMNLRPEVKDQPVAKPRVRQALSLAIDRQQVIDLGSIPEDGSVQAPPPDSERGFFGRMLDKVGL